MRQDLRNSHHLATISHDGRFWDAYLELVDDPGATRSARGRIAFSAADSAESEPVRTAVIFVEDTPPEVVTRAREFKTHQLVALLRSAEPEDRAAQEAEPEAPPDPSNDPETHPDPEMGHGEAPAEP